MKVKILKQLLIHKGVTYLYDQEIDIDDDHAKSYEKAGMVKILDLQKIDKEIQNKKMKKELKK